MNTDAIFLLPARFRAKLVIVGDCWRFTSVDKDGYGRYYIDGRPTSAHRTAFTYLGGIIPDGLQLDHLCHNRDLECPGGRSCPHRACVNPDHLEPVDAGTNTSRSPIHNGAKSHCPHGHPYDEANTYLHPSGRRVCRACNRIAARDYRARVA